MTCRKRSTSVYLKRAALRGGAPTCPGVIPGAFGRPPASLCALCVWTATGSLFPPQIPEQSQLPLISASQAPASVSPACPPSHSPFSVNNSGPADRHFPFSTAASPDCPSTRTAVITTSVQASVSPRVASSQREKPLSETAVRSLGSQYPSHHHMVSVAGHWPAGMSHSQAPLPALLLQYPVSCWNHFAGGGGLFIHLFIVQVRVLLCSPDYTGASSVDQASLQCRDLPTSASGVLKVKARTPLSGCC